MAPHSPDDVYVLPPPPPSYAPRYVGYVGRKPDLTQAWTIDALPTATVPLYTNLPTVAWQSAAGDMASSYASFTKSIASVISSESAQSPYDSMFTVTSYPPQRNPVSASETPLLQPHPPSKGLSGAALGAAAAISTLAVVCLLAGFCLILCRKSRKRRLAAERSGSSAEMAQTTTNGTNAQFAETRAYIRPPSTEPPPTIDASSFSASSSSQQNLMPEAPVLLSTTMDQSYYTGIDTSDGLSMIESRRLSIATAAPEYASSTISEPPPPYRPGSFMQRENSQRLSVAPPSYGPRLSVRSTNLTTVQSPFDDPEDDSPISEIAPSPSTSATHVRDMEEMSDVSELSYQEDPVVAHSTV